MATFSMTTDLAAHLAQKFERFPADTVITAERCPAEMQGDITINCFRFARYCGSPVAAAQAAVAPVI